MFFVFRQGRSPPESQRSCVVMQRAAKRKALDLLEELKRTYGAFCAQKPLIFGLLLERHGPPDPIRLPSRSDSPALQIRLFCPPDPKPALQIRFAKYRERRR